MRSYLKLWLPFILITMFHASCYAITFNPNEIHSKPLIPEDMYEDPMDELLQWYRVAQQELGDQEAASFVLATVDANCKPSSRTMLVKVLNDKGISFFGDARSEKFQDLNRNPYASLTFNWFPLQRQVNIYGKTVPISRADAHAVFNSRHPLSKITSLISVQSKAIESRQQLLDKHKEVADVYNNKPIPTPETWVGFTLIPEKIEFWQAGPYSLHSRVQYVRNGSRWQKTLLSP